MTPRAYTAWVIGGCLALLGPVLVLNLLLLGNDYRHDKNRLASHWQQESGGVTYAPPISNNRAFKTLRLADRLPGINTLVFGSSTAMSITADALPPGLRAYNFAQSGNSLLNVIGESRFVMEHFGGRVRWLVIPLDWALGFVYQGGAPPPTDLSAAHCHAGGRVARHCPCGRSRRSRAPHVHRTGRRTVPLRGWRDGP